MAPRLPRPNLHPAWRTVAPALLLAIAFAAILVEMRNSRATALADARNALAKAQAALAAANRAVTVASMAKSIASRGSFLPAEDKVSAIDFGCAAPQSMRLSAGCWLRGARGKFTGRKLRRGTRTLIEGGRSQAGEDLFLFENFFFNKKGGTFLEMGALDGLKYSNSYYFEKALGWTGVMIEGSPNLYAKLVQNRPGVVAINAMVCSEAQALHWIDKNNAGGGSDAVGGAWELMPEAFRKEKHGRLTPADIAKLPTVPCVSLASALARFGVRHVDLFSLDVEGAEASVIKTLDFTKFTASVIVFEDRPGSSGVKEQLLKAGYVDYGWVNPNHIFLHPIFKATLPPKV